MFKVIRANTKTSQTSTETLKDDYIFFGNRGLIAKLLTDEVNPTCDALGAENKLIFSTGLLAGTPVTTAHRLSVGAKSPLTGGIKEANSGGTFALHMAQHGIKMIIVEDVPADDKWQLLHINTQGEAAFLPADEYVGLNNYELVEKLMERFGTNISTISIGLAGERLSKISSLQTLDQSTKHPSRAAARGGLGAVAGSKKLKAIVIEKAEQRAVFPYVDKQMFDEANKKLSAICTDPQGPVAHFAIAGTISVTEVVRPQAILPVKNFDASVLPQEQYEQISANAWVERANMYGGKTGAVCQPGCLVRCSNVYKNPAGEIVTSGLEYETYAMCGPNWDITNIDFIADIDHFCDDMGLDTIDTGNVVAVLMDTAQIPWGDETAVKKVLQEMKEGKTELAKAMYEGVNAVAKMFNAKRIPSVKGQGLAAYDPRNAKGMGVTYATSTMGADHTAGYGLYFVGDNISVEGKVDYSKKMQIAYTAGDNFACAFLFPSVVEIPDVFPKLMQGAYGGEWDVAKVLEIGTAVLRMEKAWNNAAGLTREDDRLPDFMYNEPSPATGQVFDVPQEEIDALTF